jgi:histidine ammonia-lyase
MIVQYTAAALCNELAGLAMPASVVNIPTSAGIEDYNSFGPRSAAKADRAMDLVERVVAIELLCARKHSRPTARSDRGRAWSVHTPSSARPSPHSRRDRPPSPDIEAIAELIRRGAFVETV